MGNFVALNSTVPSDWVINDLVLGTVVRLSGGLVPADPGYLDVVAVDRAAGCPGRLYRQNAVLRLELDGGVLVPDDPSYFDVGALDTFALAPGRVYQATWTIRQTVDAAGEKTRRWIQWVGLDRTALSATTVFEDVPTVAGGVSTIVRVIADAAGPGVDIVSPAGAFYAVPVLRRSGTAGETVVATCRLVDVTDAYQAWRDVGIVQNQVDADAADGIHDQFPNDANDDDSALAFVDPDGAKAAFFDTAGGLHAELVTPIGRRMLHPGWLERHESETGGLAYGVTDDGQFRANTHAPAAEADVVLYDAAPDGLVLMSRTHDGEARLGPYPSHRWYCYTGGAEGGRRVYLVAPGFAGPFVVDNDPGDHVGPQINGMVLSWCYIGADGPELRRVNLGLTVEVAAGVTGILHAPCSGQSLSVGTQSVDLQSPTAPRPGRVLMLSTGVRTLENAHAPTHLNCALGAHRITGVVSAFERIDSSCGETPLTRLGVELVDRLPSTVAVLVSAHGIGSANYASLAAGTLPFTNLATAIKQARLIALLNGLTYDVLGTLWEQGEGNLSDTAAVYEAHLVELQADIEATIRGICGTSSTYPLFLSQTSSWTNYGVARREMPFGQIAAAINNPGKIICVGPKYHLSYAADGTHLTGVGSAQLGSETGVVMARHYNGQDTLPVHIVSAQRTGAVVRVALHCPTGGVNLDTAVVSDPGNYGVEYYDAGDGNSVSIASVAVDPGDSSVLLVTLSDTPTGTGQTIGIASVGVAGNHAGPLTGARASIRDGSAETSSLGVVMSRFACHQIRTIQ